MDSQVEISYDSHEERFSYVERGENHIVEENAVIGITEGSKSEFDLCYVTNPHKSQKNAEDNISFKSLSIAKPSPDVLEKFESKFPLHHVLEATNIHVVLSAASGGKHAEKFFANALKPLLGQMGYTAGLDGYKVHITQSAESINELVRDVLLPRANDGVNQLVILLSGDGGIVDIVNGLSSKPLSSQYARLRLVIIPLGTGNALAHSCGITADKTNGLSTLFRGQPRPLPLFKVHFPVVDAIDQKPVNKHDYDIHGAVVCSWGLHAALVADSDTPEYRKYGVERFKMAAKENLFPPDGSLPHEYHAKISILPSGRGEEADWKVVPRSQHAYVLVTLVSQLEAGFTISPDSKPLDGQLRLVHFGPLEGGGDEIMRIMGLAYQGGKHVTEEAVGYEEVDGVRIEFEEEEARYRRVCVDGKIVTVGLGGNVEVKKELLDVIDIFAL